MSDLGKGYISAKAEIKAENMVQSLISTNIIDAEFIPVNSTGSHVLDREYLHQTETWTQESLKARFGSCTAAHQYLKETYGLKLNRSWETIIGAFNGELNHYSLEKKLQMLEATVMSQQQRIKELEENMNQVLQVLKLNR